MQVNRNVKSEVLFGNRLSNALSPTDKDKIYFSLTGKDSDNNASRINLSPSILSKHILILGSIGTGKTNVFNGILSQVKNNMTDEDVLLIFDTKGDFYSRFYEEGDVVISNDDTSTGPSGKNYWNIFHDIELGPHMEENIIEVSKMIFAEACEKTNQIFFPNAARGIFEAILYHFIVSNPKKCSNYWLMYYINNATSREIREMLLSYEQYRAMSSYISIDDSAQTQGVLSELQQVCREVFIGNFKEVGDISIRRLIKEKNRKTIFIEYDMSVGRALTPIYSLLFDLAIKEGLSRKRSKGNVYIVVDEFSLLPNLNHIDDAVNFGRSLGIKFMIGLQNVEQMYDAYDDSRAINILSGFLTTISFNLNDSKSREFVQGIYGKNRKLDSYFGSIKAKGIVEETREGNVVEDWDITQLKVGEAIVGLPEREPFIFKFDLYE